MVNNKVTKLLFITASVALFCILQSSLSSTEPAGQFPLVLKDSTDKEISINPTAQEITVLEWFNKGCPFVKKFYQNGFMQSLQDEYTAKGVKWYTINSTKDGHTDFIKSSERSSLLEELKFKSTAVLYDELGVAGKKIGAKTTPHIFIFNGDKLVYSGAVDDSPDSDSDPKTANNNIKNSLDSILKKEDVATPKTRPYGCSIKYAE